MIETQSSIGRMRKSSVASRWSLQRQGISQQLFVPGPQRIWNTKGELIISRVGASGFCISAKQIIFSPLAKSWQNISYFVSQQRAIISSIYSPIPTTNNDCPLTAQNTPLRHEKCRRKKTKIEGKKKDVCSTFLKCSIVHYDVVSVAGPGCLDCCADGGGIDTVTNWPP